METGIKVGDLMTRNFIHVLPTTNLHECAKIMLKKRVGSLIISENNELRGILTEKDIIWAVIKKSKKDLREIFAKDLMKRKVVTVKPSADVVEVLQKVKKTKLRRFPVVENNKVIGMITTKDILRVDPGLYESISETMSIREETKKLAGIPSRVRRSEGTCEECGNLGRVFNDAGTWLCEKCYDKK